jgi:hypothetical protein
MLRRQLVRVSKGYATVDPDEQKKARADDIASGAKDESSTDV